MSPLSKTYLASLTLILAFLCLPFSACEHEPIVPDNPQDTIPTDTTDTDTTTVDTTGNNTNTDPCHPDSIYFEQQILPILLSSCAFSGCHLTANSQNDGIQLTSYATVMATADVQAYDLNDNEIYDKITDNDPDDIMPPPPYAPLNGQQISLIAQWIMQGAKNITCNPNNTGGNCNTQNVSFSQNIQPILQTNCTGCHGGAAPSDNINLSNYAGVYAVATNGRLNGSITHANGFTPMPLGLAQLPECDIAKIQAWIQAGAPNN